MTIRIAGRLRAVAQVMALVVPLASCSLVFVHGPPRDGRLDPARCTSHSGLPNADRLMAAALAGIGLLAATSSAWDEDFIPLTNATVAAIGLAGAAAYVVSAEVGARRVRHCRERARPQTPGP